MLSYRLLHRSRTLRIIVAAVRCSLLQRLIGCLQLLDSVPVEIEQAILPGPIVVDGRIGHDRSSKDLAVLDEHHAVVRANQVAIASAVPIDDCPGPHLSVDQPTGTIEAADSFPADLVA